MIQQITVALRALPPYAWKMHCTSSALRYHGDVAVARMAVYRRVSSGVTHPEECLLLLYYGPHFVALTSLMIYSRSMREVSTKPTIT